MPCAVPRNALTPKPAKTVRQTAVLAIYAAMASVHLWKVVLRAPKTVAIVVPAAMASAAPMKMKTAKPARPIVVFVLHVAVTKSVPPTKIAYLAKLTVVPAL